MRDISGLGVSVIGSAGFGWSGLFGRRTGETCDADGTLRPKPGREKKKSRAEIDLFVIRNHFAIKWENLSLNQKLAQERKTESGKM